MTLDDADVPQAAEKLLPFLLPRKLRKVIPGDLSEEFQQYRARYGRRYAVRWYWFQIVDLVVRRIMLGGGFGWLIWIAHKIGNLVH